MKTIDNNKFIIMHLGEQSEEVEWLTPAGKEAWQLENELVDSTELLDSIVDQMNYAGKFDFHLKI